MRTAWLPWLLVPGVAVADPGVVVNPDPVPAPACGCVLPGAPVLFSIRGALFLKTTGEPAIGATVTAMAGKELFTVIADERGEYRIEAPAGFYDLTVYYGEATVQLETNRLIVADQVLDTRVIDDSRPEGFTCWDFGPHVPPPELTSAPRFGGTFTRTQHPALRDRTHRAWIAPVAAADPAHAVTSIEGARRFTTAPGIPAVFVEEVATHTVNVPIERATGIGGSTDVALRSGSNERRGDAHLVLGEHEVGAETFAGGPLVKDHAWAAAGLVARRASGQLSSDGLVRLDARPNNDHDLGVLALGHALGDDRAGWGSARWKVKALDYRLEAGATATGEILVEPSEISAREVTLDPLRRLDRAGAEAYVKLRTRLAGYHALYAGVGAGTGHRDGTRHGDASYAVGDDWMPTPTLTITTGLRVEQRQFGADRAVVAAPRATVSWDPTGEGRGDVFVAYQRVPLLDDGLPGDWRSRATTSVDEVATGIAYRRDTGDTMVGLAARARADRVGADVFLRRDTAKTMVHLQASSLERVGALLAQRKLRHRGGHQLVAGATARLSEERAEGGLAVGWRHSGSRTELTTDLALEAFAGSDGPGGRMLLGILW